MLPIQPPSTRCYSYKLANTFVCVFMCSTDPDFIAALVRKGPSGSVEDCEVELSGFSADFLTSPVYVTTSYYYEVLGHQDAVVRVRCSSVAENPVLAPPHTLPLSTPHPPFCLSGGNKNMACCGCRGGVVREVPLLGQPGPALSCLSLGYWVWLLMSCLLRPCLLACLHD